jgi:hypothetical protein
MLFSKPQLLEYSGHLLYEIEMLTATLDFLDGHKQNTPINNAYLESFLIHARVIWGFVYRTRNPPSHNLKADDVIAADYFNPTTQWQPIDDKWLADHAVKINRSLAHLTIKRVSETTWPCSEIYFKLADYLKVFIKAAPRKLLVKELQEFSFPVEIKLRPIAATTSTTFAIMSPEPDSAP